MTVLHRRTPAIPVVAVLAWFALVPCARAAGSFTSSAVTSPATGSELFYDFDTSSGSVTVQGTVTPAVTTTGKIVCYSAPEKYLLDYGVPIANGAFQANVSLAFAAGQTCELEMIPLDTSVLTLPLPGYTGPVISISSQSTLSSGGSTYGYQINVGDLSWGFALGSLTDCPISASYSTDPTSFGNYSLFWGDACLPIVSGVAEAPSTNRSAVQIDGLNAYPPDFPLTGLGGYAPLGYSASWDAIHDSVTVSETDPLMLCSAPGTFPPGGTTPSPTGVAESNCPSLESSGIQVQQTTAVLPGDQVARVSQTFTDVDHAPHTLDLLVSQSVHAWDSGETPGFQFPEQPVFATHAFPDTYSPFPSGPGSVYVIADAATPAALNNPVGAITYGTEPLSASFVNSRATQTGTFLMHYVASLPPGGSYTLAWSYSQATSAAALQQLVQLETDRFYTPTVTLSAPASGSTSHDPEVPVSGQAHDPEGISTVTVDGRDAAIGSGGAFTTLAPLTLGVNNIEVTATNLAGVQATVARTVVYAPLPCVVPRLTGRTLARARALLATSGCAPGKVVRVHSKRISRGRVVSTSPRAGTRRLHGTIVRITLSDGARRARRR